MLPAKENFYCNLKRQSSGFPEMPTKQAFWQLSRVSATETTIQFFFANLKKKSFLACEADLSRGQQHRHLLSLDMIVQGCKYPADI